MPIQNPEEPEFEPPEDEAAASALPKFDERPARKLLREPIPARPAFAADIAPSGSIEELAGARHDEVYAPLLGRLKAQASSVRDFLADVAPARERLETERKGLFTHTSVEGERRPWDFTSVAGLTFFSLVSATALYVEANLLGALLKKGGTVAADQSSFLFALVPFLTSAALKGIHGLLSDGPFRTRYAIGLGIAAVLAGLTWGYGFTEVHAGSGVGSFAPEPEGLPPLGEVPAEAPSSNPNLLAIRAGILCGVSVTTLLWILMAGIAKSRTPMLRALHPDFLLNALLTRVLRRREMRAKELLGELEGRIQSLVSGRATYVGDALQAYRARMGGMDSDDDWPRGRAGDVPPRPLLPDHDLFRNGASNHA